MENAYAHNLSIMFGPFLWDSTEPGGLASGPCADAFQKPRGKNLRQLFSLPSPGAKWPHRKKTRSNARMQSKQILLVFSQRVGNTSSGMLGRKSNLQWRSSILAMQSTRLQTARGVVSPLATRLQATTHPDQVNQV